jgi:hypothetical protein
MESRSVCSSSPIRKSRTVDLSKGDQAGAIAAVENVLARLKGLIGFSGGRTGIGEDSEVTARIEVGKTLDRSSSWVAC